MILNLLLEDKNSCFVFVSGNYKDRYVPKGELQKVTKEINPEGELYTKELERQLNAY